MFGFDISRKYEKFTDAEDAYLRENYPRGFLDDIAKHLQRTPRSIQCRVHTLGLKKDEKKKRVSRIWTNELRELTALMYPDMDTVELAEFLGVSTHMVKDESQRQGILKSPEFIQRMRVDALSKARKQFVAGQRPWNAGIADSSHPMHERGHYRNGPGPKALPIGTIREHPRMNGGKLVMYRDIKVALPSEWDGLHRWKWSQYHGKPVPPGHSIVFRDGNHDNYEKDNLICLTFEELSMCSTRNLPYAVLPLVKRSRALNKAIRVQEKALKQKS